MNLKLDHINLTVSNLPKSIEWYKEIFGMALLEKGDSIAQRPWAIVGKDDNMICMTEFSQRDGTQEGSLGDYHQINHFGFRVDDEERWQETVKEHSLKLYYGGVNEYPHSRSWYIKDPSGHTIEVSYSNKKRLKFPLGS